MYISPDPDSKGKPPKRQDLEAREAQATRDGEVLSTAKSRVAALGKALHELQTNGDDADAAEVGTAATVAVPALCTCTSHAQCVDPVG